MIQFPEWLNVKSFAGFLLLIFMPAITLAQQGASIEGYITDKETDETLISANIALAEISKGTSSNASGYFKLSNIEPGTYEVTATYIGYQKFSKEITLTEGQSLQIDIGLQPEGYELEEIVVKSARNSTERRDIGLTEIGSDLIKNVPAMFQEDIFRSLQLLPGIKASSDISSGLHIRGGSPDQTLIQLDGTTIYNPTHFFGFFSTFNPDAVEDITLHKGGYSAKFGGRLGSVVDLKNKKGNPEEFQGSLTLGLLASRASFEGPFKNGSWMFAARRSTLEPALHVLKNYEDNIPESFYFMDMNGKINFEPNDKNSFNIGIYSGYDSLDFPYSSDASINLNYGNQVFSSSWRHSFSNYLQSNLSVKGSRYFQFPSFSVTSTSFERSNNIYDFSLSGSLEYISESHHISSGFELGSLTIKLQDVFDDQETFNSRIQSHYGSWYLQDEWNLSDNWKATPGIRINGFSNGDYVRFEPRFSLEYHPSERFRLQGAYGRYHQFVSLSSQQIVSGSDVWLTSSEGVPPSYSDQYVFGIKTMPLKNYALDVEVYYRTMEDLFELDPFIPDRAGIPYQDTFRFGEGYAYGAEVLLERKIGKLTGFASYTLSFTRRKFPGFNKPLGEDGPAQFYPPKHDRLHEFNLVLNYSFSSRWSASAVFNYASGQPFTKPLGRTTAFEVPTSATDKHQIILGRINASRQPDYNRLDVGISRKGSFFGIGESEWQLQAINVYSRRNVWFYDYDLDANPAERNTVKLLPVIPTISYTLNF